MPTSPITAVFDAMTEPRTNAENKLRLLTDNLALTECAIIGGAET